MSSFFGAPGSGPSSGSGANGSSSSNSGTSGGGGGWGSFLKQGLSSIESKLDMVLDMQVPIPGGSSGTLTSLSPHATVLPTSMSGSANPKTTQPKKQAPLHIPEEVATEPDSRDDDVPDPNKEGTKRTSIPVTKSNLRGKGGNQDTAGSEDKRKGVVGKEDDLVTVDPFTGMITTTPGVKRMSTPPVSAGAGSTATANAAAIAATAARERLEQRMRGIFKKPAESAPSSPPPSSTAASPSSSAGQSTAVEREEKTEKLPESDGKEETQEIIPSASKTEKKDTQSALSDLQEEQTESNPETKETTFSTTQESSDTAVSAPDGQDEGNGNDEESSVMQEVVTEVRDDQPPVTANDESLKESAEENTEEEHIVETPVVCSEEDSDLLKSKEESYSAEDTAASTQDESVIAEVITDQTDSAPPAISDDASHPTPLVPATDHAYTPSSSEHISQADSTATKQISNADKAPVKEATEIKSKAKGESTIIDASSLKRVIEQREEQLFKVMQEQSSLLERLRDLEDAKAAEDAVQTAKVAGLEKIIESQKKELEVARGGNLASQPKSIQKTLEEQRGLLEDKDEQIRGLLAEGEVLSKKEFKNLTTIKTLRTKNIEAEKIQMDTQKKLDKATSENADAQAKIAKLVEENKQLNDTARSLHETNQRQHKQMSKMEAELVQLREEKASLKMGLDRAWQELADARKASAELSSQTHAAALDREMKMNEELQIELDALKAQHAAVESILRQDIQELRVSLSNREEDAGRKEDELLMEIRNLQARLEQNDNDSYELQEALDEARRPLLRQIEVLQNQQGTASRNWEKIEKSLTRRVTEAEEDVAKAQDRERAARDKLDEMKSQQLALEARLETLRIADTQLRSDVNASKRSLVEKEEEARHAQADLSRERVNRERAIEEAREDAERRSPPFRRSLAFCNEENVLLLDCVGFIANAGRRTARDGIFKDRSKWQQQHTDELRFHHESHKPGWHGANLVSQRLFTYHDWQWSPGIFCGLNGSWKRLNRSCGGNGEIKYDGSSTGRPDELSDELVRVTMELEELQIAATRVPGLEQELSLLRERHRAALEMLGERTEEVQELKADLSDVKEAYRDQINELLAQLENLRRTNAQ
ncbi:TATA element modulatory factor 1 [Mortierella sp. GBA30]|nr:TATA element modulatory factor 1 [Mortierella sp. GBA30]